MTSAEPAPATNLIRVMTFNLRYASAADGANAWVNPTQSPQRREVAVSVLTNRAPDIVGFQEGEDGQLDFLAASLPGYGFERRRPSGGGGNENAAFAWNTNRVALLDRGVYSLGTAPGGSYWNNTPGTPFDPYAFFPGMGLNFPRIALWGRFRWLPTGQEFLFTTTHFDFNDEPQVRSAALITDDSLSRARRMPMSPLALVVGDFNCSHLDRAWALFTGTLATNGITGDFKDAWFDLYGSWFSSGTLHGFAGGTPPESQRIDWILHRGGFTGVHAQVLYDSCVATNLTNGSSRTQYPSDHYPVMADLRFPDPPPDYDGDGLPDAAEFASPLSLATDADSDDDGLVDGAEDLDGNGAVSGGESDPSAPTPPRNPTDLRDFAMDGVRDHRAKLLATNGLELHARFDGRHLYLATQDAGEGSDHFLFIGTNPADAVAAPWSKSGQVGRWLAFLADENDGGFHGWFDASGTQISDPLAARSASYFQNGGRIEGVIDLGVLLGSGFTSSIFVAAAPYGTADGGVLVQAAQVPTGNGDGNLLGAAEYVRIAPGDADGDGLSDAADPDADGDGLPDLWATRHGLTDGGDGDEDGDGASNRQELDACTDPSDAASVLEVRAAGNGLWAWDVPMGKTSTLTRSQGFAFDPAALWVVLAAESNAATFPWRSVTSPVSPAPGFLRVELSR